MEAAAGLVPSLPSFNYRVHGEGEAFFKGSKGQLALHWDQRDGAPTQGGRPALGSTDGHQSPGWVAHEPQGNKQRAQPQQGTASSRKAQTSCSSASFTDPSPIVFSLSLYVGPSPTYTIVSPRNSVLSIRVEQLPAFGGSP